MKTILIMVVLAAISGCTTTQNLSEAGDKFSKGEIVDGTITTLLTPLALIVDVFTLGGTLDAEQSLDAWQKIEQLEQQSK